MLSLSILAFVALSFFPSLVILTFYFSSIIGANSTKHTFHQSGFVISFSGLAIGAAFALATPFLPDSIPAMDVGIVFAVVTWILLLRHYCGTGWLESLPSAFLAAIVYVVIVAVASGFSILLLQV